MTYQISPYTYKGGYSCYCLHTGNKATKDSIILEASKRETVEYQLRSLERNAKDE
jgi:hypothetical protein